MAAQSSVREVSSVFVAWSVVYLLLLVGAVSGGSAGYERFLAWSAQPAVVLLNLVSLFFVAFHAVTWFNLAPQAMVGINSHRRATASSTKPASPTLMPRITFSTSEPWVIAGQPPP